MIAFLSTVWPLALVVAISFGCGFLGQKVAQFFGDDTLQIVAEYAHQDLELIHHLRLTMEDLRSRDPQLEESLSVGLLELDQREPIIAALAAGDYKELRRLKREAQR